MAAHSPAAGRARARALIQCTTRARPPRRARPLTQSGGTRQDPQVILPLLCVLACRKAEKKVRRTGAGCPADALGHHRRRRHAAGHRAQQAAAHALGGGGAQGVWGVQGQGLGVACVCGRACGGGGASRARREAFLPRLKRVGESGGRGGECTSRLAPTASFPPPPGLHPLHRPSPRVRTHATMSAALLGSCASLGGARLAVPARAASRAGAFVCLPGGKGCPQPFFVASAGLANWRARGAEWARPARLACSCMPTAHATV